MASALAAAAIAVILFLGVLFWSSAPRAVAGLVGAGWSAPSTAKDTSSRAQVADERVEDVSADLEDAATRANEVVAAAGEAAVQAARDASEPVALAVLQQAQEAPEAGEGREALEETTAERVESVADAVEETAAETVKSVEDAVRDVTADAVKEAAADKLLQAAEKLAQAAEKLEALAARAESSAPPAEGTDGSDAEPGPAPPRASEQARGRGPAPSDVRRAAPAPSETRPAGPVATSTADTLTASARSTAAPASSGRAPWLLMPRPAPSNRVTAGPLVVEARGRGDAPIAQIRLVLDGAALPVFLEQRGDATWRARAAISVAPGPHVVDAVVVDAAGRTGSYRWRFDAAR